MDKKKSIVLVTGAGGLIGSAVCYLLNKRNESFIALYRIRPNVDPEWDFICGDILTVSLLKLLVHVDVRAIVHCAAAIPNDKYDFQECYKINKLIDKNIAAFIQKKNISKLIYISTTNIYGDSIGILTEKCEPKEENLYSKAKLESEQMFTDLKNLSTTVLRINAPYHFTQQNNTVLKIFIEKIYSGKDVTYHGSGARQQDFTNTMDIAESVLCALNSTIQGIYNIASGHSISMKKLGELILKKFPSSASKISASGIADGQEQYRALFDISKAAKELNWEPKISLEQGITDWIKYLQL